MTYKEKICEAVEKRYEYWREKEFNSHSTESEIRMSECQHLLLMLNSLQEEPISEELYEAANDYGVNIRKGYPRVMDETDKYIYDAFKAGAQWQRDQILNCNATLLRTFELGKIEMKHQILKAMDLGEPPYLISVEKAYYDVKKLLEDEV